jgi:hypothetical protein
VGKVRRLLTGRGASRRGFESLTLRTSRRSLLGRSASVRRSHGEIQCCLTPSVWQHHDPWLPANFPDV